MKKKCADIFKERLQMAMGTISQRDLAKMSGLTEATISRYLKGERIPKLTDAITLANVLHAYMFPWITFPVFQRFRTVIIKKLWNIAINKDKCGTNIV